MSTKSAVFGRLIWMSCPRKPLCWGVLFAERVDGVGRPLLNPHLQRPRGPSAKPLSNMAHIRQSRPDYGTYKTVSHIRQSRPNMAHIRQSRPDSGRGFQAKVLKLFQVVPSSLGRGCSPTATASSPAKAARSVHEAHTLHTTPYTPRLTPYTLHPTPYTPHPTPYTLFGMLRP